MMFALVLSGTFACNSLLDGDALPPDIADPAVQRTPAGAMARYRGTLALLPRALDEFLTETAVLTDELAALPAPLGVSGTYTGIDSRTDLSLFKNAYTRLQAVRVDAREARGFVAKYAPDSSSAIVGHLMAVEGYAEVLLADLFCSGIPLSSVDFGGQYTLRAGSTTAEVYRHAIALFDSAITLTGDSVALQRFSLLGKARASIALGDYDQAGTAVVSVPTTYAYRATFVPGQRFSRLMWAFGDTRLATAGGVGYRALPAVPSIGNMEGGNGLQYRVPADRRVTSVARTGTDPNGNTMFFPTKYGAGTSVAPANVNVTLTVADGVEARLIEAEAALYANADDGRWLGILNALRQTAITPALPDLVDPGQDGTGTNSPRVDLLFQERAFWLYLTGHRQGDLRRLIREYGRAPDAVYPTGVYPGGPGGYGTEIVAPVPPAEVQLNPKYSGCVHRGA